jgi:hypothetical protein
MSAPQGIVTVTDLGRQGRDRQDRRHETSPRATLPPSLPCGDHRPRCLATSRVRPQPAGVELGDRVRAGRGGVDHRAHRGIVVCYETVRRWCKKFGQTLASRLRHGPGTSGTSMSSSSESGACSTISGARWIRTASCSTLWFRIGVIPTHLGQCPPASN